jgi:hypothetical protein
VSQPIALAGLVAVAAALAYALAYAVACAVAPFGPCRCHGRDVLCRRCDGTGYRVRVGRRLWAYLRRLYHDAH